MSLETWKAEFYPVDANDVPSSQALDHSIKKWIGLRSLKEHGLVRTFGGITDGDHRFKIDSSSCALCERFFDLDASSPCNACPLAQSRGGVPCDELSDQDIETDAHETPYGAWMAAADPEPMITALERAKILNF